MENFQKFSVKPLKSKQKKAIEMLIYQGMNKSQVASILKITPQTLSNWLNPGKNPHFVEAYEKELIYAERMRKSQYKIAAQKALDRMTELSRIVFCIFII